LRLATRKQLFIISYDINIAEVLLIMITLSIKTRIYGGFILILLLLVIVAIIGNLNFKTTKEWVEEYVRIKHIDSTIRQIETNVVDMQRNIQLFSQTGDNKIPTD